jgi:hypothetical protein
LERDGPDHRTDPEVLLSDETFTAFFLDASFFGTLLFGRARRPVVLPVFDRHGRSWHHDPAKMVRPYVATAS